jgi:nucleoside-diphosphate-sugar epimerase
VTLQQKLAALGRGNMTTLVTGATGFVGSHVVEMLRKRGDSVRALVRNAAKAQWLRDQDVEVIVGDLRDPAVVREAVRGVRVVHHCGAAVGPYTKKEIYSTNLDGVRNLLDAVQQAGRARVVLLSSVNVLGTRNLDPATEETAYRYSSDPAADVKIEAERLALDYHQRHGLDVVILRPGFIYGPGDPHNLPKLISSLQRGKFRFIGSRSNVVPIVHVLDVAWAMLLAAAAPNAGGRIYQITDGSRTTIGGLVDQIAELVGCAKPQKVLPFAVPALACTVFDWLQRLKLRKKPGPVTRASLRFVGTSRYVDIARARRELGYEPQMSLREGLAQCVPEFVEKADVGASAVHAS